MKTEDEDMGTLLVKVLLMGENEVAECLRRFQSTRLPESSEDRATA